MLLFVGPWLAAHAELTNADLPAPPPGSCLKPCHRIMGSRSGRPVAAPQRHTPELVGLCNLAGSPCSSPAGAYTAGADCRRLGNSPGAPQHVGDNGEEEGSQERQAGGECPGQGRRREASGGLGGPDGGPWLSMPDAAAGTRPGAGMKQGREATAWLVVPTAAALAAPGRRGSRLSGFAAT